MNSIALISKDGDCHYSSRNIGATLTGFVNIPSKNEVALQQAVTTVGPVSIGKK